MITVSTLRDLNNRYGEHTPTGRVKVLVCSECCRRFSGDLARYWSPRDEEHFDCPDCDIELGLQFHLPYPDTLCLPLAPRRISAEVDC